MATNDFRKKVDELPQAVKQIILSNKTAEIISRINDKYKLNLEQRGIIAQIIGKIIIKEIPIYEFANAVKTQTNLNSETAKLLTADIVQEIFLSVRKYFPGIENLLIKSASGSNHSESSNIVDLKNLNRE